MRNLLDERPGDSKTPRLVASSEFMQGEDVRGKDVLDIGCGFGWCEIDLLARGASRVFAVDVSEATLAIAREHITDPRVEFAVASATALPTRDGSLDTVVSWEVIEHIPKGSEPIMFAEVGRVLRPGGVFYLSTPFDSAVAKALDPAWWLVGHRHYGRDELVRLGRGSGFEAEVVCVMGGIWSLFSAVDMYTAKWIFRRRPFFEAALQRRERREYEQDGGSATLFVKFRKPLSAAKRRQRPRRSLLAVRAVSADSRSCPSGDFRRRSGELNAPSETRLSSADADR